VRRDEALAVIAAHKHVLRSYGVKHLSIFGSVARDEAGPVSDVDILVEFAKPIGLFGFVDVKDYLEQILNCRVDLVTEEGLRREMRDQILREAVPAA
jgi:uncharacterized protein